VVAACPCGCASIDFVYAGSTKTAGLRSTSIIAEAITRWADGTQAGVMLWGNMGIVATPSPDDLVLDSVAIYPPSVGEPYAKQLLLAVGRAAVDEFFAAGWHAYRGCKLVVQEVGWDEIMSSEVAIYRAARGALLKVRQEGKWELVT
jgi:hypothetical protein